MVILACQQEQYSDGSSVFKSSNGFPLPKKYEINGHGQIMEQDKIVIDQKIYREETLVTCRENQYYPIVFFMQSKDETDTFRNILCCTFIKNGDSYDIKLKKHTIFYNGQYYNTQEIYGLKDSEVGVGEEMGDEDLSSQKVCIICYDDQKNTMLIPCRHLCLCYGCAKSLSEQPIDRRTCPICRKCKATIVSDFLLEIQSFIKVEQK